jgi:hypothetical protein
VSWLPATTQTHRALLGLGLPRQKMEKELQATKLHWTAFRQIMDGQIAELDCHVLDVCAMGALHGGAAAAAAAAAAPLLAQDAPSSAGVTGGATGLAGPEIQQQQQQQQLVQDQPVPAPVRQQRRQEEEEPSPGQVRHRGNGPNEDFTADFSGHFGTGQSDGADEGRVQEVAGSDWGASPVGAWDGAAPTGSCISPQLRSAMMMDVTTQQSPSLLLAVKGLDSLRAAYTAMQVVGGGGSAQMTAAEQHNDDGGATGKHATGVHGWDATDAAAATHQDSAPAAASEVTVLHSAAQLNAALQQPTPITMALTGLATDVVDVRVKLQGQRAADAAEMERIQGVLDSSAVQGHAEVGGDDSDVTEQEQQESRERQEGEDAQVLLARVRFP